MMSFDLILSPQTALKEDFDSKEGFLSAISDMLTHCRKITGSTTRHYCVNRIFDFSAIVVKCFR